MPEDSKHQKEANPNPGGGTKPRRRRARTILRWALALLLLLAVFHRPLLRVALRTALIRIAAKHYVNLDVHFAGTFFTNLTISGVRALPNGTGPTPIEKIAIDSIHLEYSIPMLVRHGVGEFLKSYEVQNADLVFGPFTSKTTEAAQQKQSLAQDLNNLLGQPALYADRVQIENFNITVRSPDETTEVKGIHLFLHPWQPGYLRVARIQAPGMPAWENISAETSYAGRNLFIRRLKLAPELEIDELNFDASRRAQGKGSMAFAAHLFGGTARVSVVGTQLNKKGKNLQNSYDTKMKIDAAGIDAHAAAVYFGAGGVPQAQLAWLTADFAGEPEAPRTWKGAFAARIESLSTGAVHLDSAELDTTFADGQATILNAAATLGMNTVLITGKANLPGSINDFSGTDGALNLRIDAADLKSVDAVLPSPQNLAGAVRVGGTMSLARKVAACDLAIEATDAAASGCTVHSAKIQIKGSKKIGSGDLYDGSQCRLTGDITGIGYGAAAVDSAKFDVESEGPAVNLRSLQVTRAENIAEASGTCTMPGEGKDFLAAPLAMKFSIKAPKLEAFGLSFKEHSFTGRLEGEGAASNASGALNGSASITGEDFALGSFKAAKLSIKAGVAANNLNIDEMRLAIDRKNEIAITGKAGLQTPNAYEGAVLIQSQSLASFQPVLDLFGIKEKLSGIVDLSIESQGKLQPQEHSGQLKLTADKVKYGNIDIREARIAGLFTPASAETSQLRVVFGATSFEGALAWSENRLRVRDINLRQGAQQVLSGFVTAPFEPFNKEEGPVPFTKRVAANVNVTQLDLDKLFTSLGQKAPIGGTVSASLIAGGTLVEPAATLKVAAKNIVSKAGPKLEPAEFDLTAHYAGKELTLDTIVKQKEIQPLTIKGRFPVDLDALARNKAVDPNLPLDVTVKLPPTSLAFLPKLVSTMRSAAGTASLDAHITGTVGKPKLAGSAAIKIDYARMKSEGVPEVGTMQANFGFTEDSVSIQKLHGDLGGGLFDVTGKVQFPKITEPVLDIHLRTKSVLAMRNDSLTVRLDSDLAATGPLAAGKVAGTIWITQSRFFRDIDILPIALPGRPKPQPPKSVAGPEAISLGPPLDAWTFDIAIKTRANDPFVIKSNLANGGAAVDLKLGGMGSHPWLDGTVHIEHFTASLPFSKLNITRGFVTFSRTGNPFDPTLDISAESDMQSYRVSVYIYGSAKDPQLSLTSEPPLAQQDILSLLATGTTTSELTGGGNVLASRAAVLVFEQLYHKIFKKSNPAENLPLHDRFTFDAGAVDSRTGRQQLAATFKLTDKLFLIGDVDLTGQFTGRVRYLIRFR